MVLPLLLVVAYVATLLFIFCYALIQLDLTLSYNKFKKKKVQLQTYSVEDLSIVTVQLPIFNEQYVVEDLIDCIVALDYPREKLEIQVLDDSTDRTSDLIKSKIKIVQEQQIDIQHITRENRIHFKAGALKEGLKTAKGEFIAIFDADFLPQPNWLKQTIPFFNNQSIAVVQTRWGHLNRDYSWLTKAQAFALDYHFRVEQVGRSYKGHFINFNGTAGVWRKTAILDAGDWEGDTLTEDLDLSYRAQLKGWKIHYLEDVITTAELPIVMGAARSQQFRWNKGGAENFRKTIKQVFSSKILSFSTKIHAFFQLLNSSIFLAILLLSVLSVPLVFIKAHYVQFNFIFELSSVFLISTLLFMFCYWTSYKQEYGNGTKSFLSFIGRFFSFFAIAIGLTWNNALAVLEGYFRKKSAFIRTPKFNVHSKKEKSKRTGYLYAKDVSKLVVEGLLLLYFVLGILAAIVSEEWFMLPFHCLLVLGFSFVFFQSIIERK